MNRYFRITLMATLAVSCSAGWSAKVCIDPGHGGSDPGAVGDTQQEKTNALNTSLKFRNWLNADTNDGGGGGSWQVLMTRTTDVSVSLIARSNYANSNGVARFMSIHNNACCGASGTETFSHTSNGSLSNDLRNKIQDRSIQAWGLPNRGVKQADFSVLRETNMPATLAELGFITHATDRTFLGNATQQDKMGKYHMYALQNHYGITAYTPGTGTTLPTYVDDSPVVSANWSTGTSAGDKYGADYKFRSTAAISDAATWSVNVGTAGSYKIQAWWSAGTNRSTGAPYVLPNGATVNVNQQASGGQWNTLGTVSLATGLRDTKLSCWAGSGFIVVADAIRYTP